MIDLSARDTQGDALWKPQPDWQDGRVLDIGDTPWTAYRTLPCTVLYRINADGGNMERLSQGMLSEFTPAVLDDGRILYTRWEYVYKGIAAIQPLWAMRPDGSGSEDVYGNNIRDPGPGAAAETPAASPANEPVDATATLFLTDVYEGLPGVERGEVKHLRVLRQVERPWSVWPHGSGDTFPGQMVAVSWYSHIWATAGTRSCSATTGANTICT